MKVNASYRTLRRLLGELGLLLPVILLIGNGFVIEPSISDFFYTRMGTVFTGVLIAFGLFLFTYRGHDKDPKLKEWISDNRVTNIAGVLAILTALVPTSFTEGKGRECMHVFCENSATWGTFHLICAAGFLLIMGLIAIFKFTLGPKEGAKPVEAPTVQNSRYNCDCLSGIYGALHLPGLERKIKDKGWGFLC